MGAEDTFPSDLKAWNELQTELEKIGHLVADRLSRHRLKGKTITVKIKYFDFRQITRSFSVDTPLSDEESILKIAMDLLAQVDHNGKGIRLLGISVSNFRNTSAEKPDENEDQLKLF